jgi:hypothetical protein
LQTVAVNHLPLIDAGDFVPGNNLRSMVEYIPGDYRYMSVYRKDSTEVTLPADTIHGEEWELVKTYSELVTPGTEPLIGNFSIVDWEYDMDIADELLADTGNVYLVVIEDVEMASVTHIDKINDLYDYCLGCNQRFCAVSASGEDALALWAKRTGAEYPILWADDIMLKTIVRANPGLLLVKDGKVVEKRNINDVPDIDYIAQEASLGAWNDYIGVMRGWEFWLLLFAVPVAVLLFLDMFAVPSKKKRK